jgi:hypothetical protein
MEGEEAEADTAAGELTVTVVVIVEVQPEALSPTSV